MFHSFDYYIILNLLFLEPYVVPVRSKNLNFSAFCYQGNFAKNWFDFSSLEKNFSYCCQLKVGMT